MTIMKIYGVEMNEFKYELDTDNIKSVIKLLLYKGISLDDCKNMIGLFKSMKCVKRIGEELSQSHKENKPISSENAKHRLAHWSADIGCLNKEELFEYAIYYNLLIDDLTHFFKIKPIKKPVDIVLKLDQTIQGQKGAKRTLAIEIYKHYLRNINGMTCPRSNQLLIGESGTGKTFICRSISKILKVPFLHIDAASLVANGIIGTSFSEYFKYLYESQNCDVERCKQAIVFIDEFDKLAIAKHNGYSIQTELLNVIGEGGSVSISINRHHEKIRIDTSSMLFILGGAFDKLSKKNDRIIGFQHRSIDESIRQSLKGYGIIPELLNRIGSITILVPFTVEYFSSILRSKEQSPLRIYEEYAQYHSNTIEFTDDFIEALSIKAFETGMNGRALQPIIEDVMKDYLFECPSVTGHKLTINSSNLK